MAYETIPPSGGSQTTTVTLAATSDTIGITGLAGETDGNYKIMLDLTISLTGTRTLIFRPNALTTNQDSNTDSSYNGALTATAQSGILLLNTLATVTRVKGTFYFESKSGTLRRFWGDLHTNRPGAAAGQTNRPEGWWTATGTVLTDFSFLYAEANAIQIGSRMTVEKLRETS